MNVAVRTLQTSPLSRAISWQLPFSENVIAIVLLVAVLVSALGLIYVKDSNRRLMGQLQTIQMTREQLHISWSQLLLEEGAWTAQTRIQQIATRQFGMVMPGDKSIVVVNNL